MRKLVLSFVLAVVMAAAADLAGTYKGNALRADGTPAMDIHLVLKQDGERWLGTVGPSADEQVPISNAKLDGQKITFDVVTDSATYKVSLVSEGENLNGGATREGVEAPPMKIVLKKAK